MAQAERVDLRTRDTRDRIRAVAIKLFYERGFAATSIREITAACSVTPPALYNHYPSKEDILVDIFQRTRARIDHLLKGAVEEGGESPTSRLALIARDITWYHAEHREEAVVVLTERGWLPEGERRQLRKWQAGFRRLVEDVLREGMGAGEMSVPLSRELKDAVPLTAKAVMDMWTKIGMWFRVGGGISSRDAARLYARLTLETVGAPSREDAIDSKLGANFDAKPWGGHGQRVRR